MSVKNWIIKKLGGITQKEFIDLRVSYSDWAQKNLCAKDGSISPDVSFYVPFAGDKILVLRSYTTICDGQCRYVDIAPWVIGVVFSRLDIEGKRNDNRT